MISAHGAARLKARRFWASQPEPGLVAGFGRGMGRASVLIRAAAAGGRRGRRGRSLMIQTPHRWSWAGARYSPTRRWEAAMAGELQFMIGARARCTDGHCGEVRRLVIDPATGTVTHLVIEPGHRQEAGRLVPVHLAE